MRRIFVDTQYFVALANRKDQWRDLALQKRAEIVDAKFVTTEAVLIEVLNFLCEHGKTLREQVSLFVRDVLEDADFEVISFQDTTLLDGIEFYESRPDKGYSLTDCISMKVCRELGLKDVLTHDHHFAQEGFRILL
jgi:predicted nucleic acid-binding protein